MPNSNRIRYFIVIAICQNLLIDIDINIDIFQNSPIDIDIDIDIFQNSIIDIDINIFRMALSISISISIFSKISLSISISIPIFFRNALSISISIFFESVDISTIDIRYRYIEQGYLLKKRRIAPNQSPTTMRTTVASLGRTKVPVCEESKNPQKEHISQYLIEHSFWIFMAV